MGVFAVFIIVFTLLILSIANGIFVLYPLIIGLVLFSVLAVKRGNSPSSVVAMILGGAKKSLMIVQIFFLIGALIGLWMSSGTIAYIVFYGIKFIIPQFFILFSFILTCGVSMVLGTSFGTVGTVGVVLITMARAGQINLFAVGGAILAGAYFGDRCSPMSSSANLVAFISGTDLYQNIKKMIRTSIVPIFLSLLAYGILSIFNPLEITDMTILNEIPKSFSLNVYCGIPLIVIIALALFRVKVKRAMFLSGACALLIAVIVQKRDFLEIIKAVFFGFSLESSNPLSEIIKGGGIISMIKTILMVMVSSAFSGIFEKTDLIKSVENFVERLSKKFGVLPASIITSFITSSFGCTQALAIILNNHLLKKPYLNSGKSNSDLALDIEDTVVVISPVIPWNVAGSVPASMIMLDWNIIPFAFYLFLQPLSRLIFNSKKGRC